MFLSLSGHLTINEIKEGIALFNCFTGNTHFLPSSFSRLVTALIKAPCSKTTLLELFLCDSQKDAAEIDIMNEQFDQFIAEALNSGIIVET